MRNSAAQIEIENGVVYDASDYSEKSIEYRAEDLPHIHNAKLREAVRRAIVKVFIEDEADT